MSIWLHLQDKFAIANSNLRSTENCTVGIKSSVVSLVPFASIKRIEVILPVELEASGNAIEGVCFDKVELKLPWHVFWIETMTPGLESWSPEVHHDALRLVHVLSGGISVLDPSNFSAIYAPGDVLGMPYHLIDVPVVGRLEVVEVIVALELGVAISVLSIH